MGPLEVSLMSIHITSLGIRQMNKRPRQTRRSNALFIENIVLFLLSLPDNLIGIMRVIVF
jgi:hypothetical protein